MFSHWQKVKQHIFNVIRAHSTRRRRRGATPAADGKFKGRAHRPRNKNNLYSINQLAKEEYTSIFASGGFKVYDTANTKIRVTRDAVLRGWYCPDKDLWRIPLLHKGKETEVSATV